jgi:SAM-dependent methyltransferase
VEQGDPVPLGSSFGGAAAAYAQHRPDYAQAAVHWALAEAPGRRVLDLGAGTGKLTASLATAGYDVVAVEPDPAMLAELRRSVPHVPALPGSAEAIPLPDGSVDAVVAGHALHWFDMALAGPEMTRVLMPDGTLAGLWNVVDDRVDWVAEVARVGGSAALGTRDVLSSWRAATAGTYLPGAGAVARFGRPERREFPHEQRHTADSLTAKIATHAGLLVMAEPERIATLDRIRGVLAGSSETAVGEFRLPMLTAVLRVYRV